MSGVEGTVNVMCYSVAFLIVCIPGKYKLEGFGRNILMFSLRNYSAFIKLYCDVNIYYYEELCI